MIDVLDILLIIGALLLLGIAIVKIQEARKDPVKKWQERARRPKV